MAKSIIRWSAIRSYSAMIIVTLTSFYLMGKTQSSLLDNQNIVSRIDGKNSVRFNQTKSLDQSNEQPVSSNVTAGIIKKGSSVASSEYLDKLNNLERSVAAVLIKVAYGTTSTTKRSIPDSNYILGLTTVATPYLTTLRYQPVPQFPNSVTHQRSYEMDLERDHALPTSAPNADILKSNNNPTYPNPNRHHSKSHDRDRLRHTLQYNATIIPPSPNLMKKVPSKGQPTIPMFPAEIPLYSPPSRSFFTPPLPPEYQNPFADKPTLRGTNNEGPIVNTVSYSNRRPIPPPSLTPGHERIPFRPPELTALHAEANNSSNSNGSVLKPVVDSFKKTAQNTQMEFETLMNKKKTLNTVARDSIDDIEPTIASISDDLNNSSNDKPEGHSNINRQEVLPNIRRILGSIGRKGDIPAVLLRHVTHRPVVSYSQLPVSAVVSADNTESFKESRSTNQNKAFEESSTGPNSNINKSKQSVNQYDYSDVEINGVVGVTANNISQFAVTTLSAATSISDTATTSITLAPTYQYNSTDASVNYSNSSRKTEPSSSDSKESSMTASDHNTWTWAWNIHVYLSVVLFTVLSVYSLYKLLTYSKLTHLFAQSYFVYIHLILISICIMRIFYLCFDAYNINGSFHIFAAEILLNLPSTFLTVAFSVLILFLFLKSLNQKNNRYSALVRPLTVVVGCGVHVMLCITLHYVESYTIQNHMNFHQQQYFRRHQQFHHLSQSYIVGSELLSPILATTSPSTSLASPPQPPRVLSLICQIIYIFICISLGFLYLYLYRVLKRILKSKSQNYILGYQNLSYAIHITIATALLFVLLASLQIFGAVFVSSMRSIIVSNVVEFDWMHWGYQFSLRLIEIAIITLISWVTGLKTNVNNTVNSNGIANGDLHMIGPVSGNPSSGSTIREKKHCVNLESAQSSHSNVANFFLPCTSGASQEHFENDYPAICNANTNLHTYTMRTGKLIYDDSYALSSLTSPTAVATDVSPGGQCTEYQQEAMYQRPYDTGSLRSDFNHEIATEYSVHEHRYHPQHQIIGHQTAAYVSNDYMTDVTTDHYENPNFDLNAKRNVALSVLETENVLVAVGKQKATKNTISYGSGCGTGSSGHSQQQMLLQSDSCYSEPMQENCSFEFNNFQKPVFKDGRFDRGPDRNTELSKNRDRQQSKGSIERSSHENSERRSSNSTNSGSSSNGVPCTSYNSYERRGVRHFNGVRKSGTLNNIGSGLSAGLIMGSGPEQRTIAGLSTRTSKPSSKRLSGTKALALVERSQVNKKNGGSIIHSSEINEFYFDSPKDPNEVVIKKLQPNHQHRQLQDQHEKYYSHSTSDEDDEEEDDEIVPGCNVERTNLIATNQLGFNMTSQNDQCQPHLHVQTTNVKSYHSSENASELNGSVPSATGAERASECTTTSEKSIRIRAQNMENVDHIRRVRQSNFINSGINC